MKINSLHRAGLAEILFENLKGEYGFVVGKANTHYTLWKYYREDRDGVPYLAIEYLHILSNRRSRVEMNFPGIYICEEFRGEKKMVLEGQTRGKNGRLMPASAPKKVDDFMSLPFGQFKGIEFRKVSDWYWCMLANSGSCTWTDAWDNEFDFTDMVTRKCEELGCKKYDGVWYTQDKLANARQICNEINHSENERPELEAVAKSLGCIKLMGRWYEPEIDTNEPTWKATAMQILPLIEAGMTFSFVPNFNGNEFWFGIPIQFKAEDKHDVYTYYGSSHYLKITNKKGEKVNKRVKGKTITVSEYEIHTNDFGKPYLLVNKFNIT